MKLLLTSLLTLLILTACASYNTPNPIKRAACNKLKSEMVFGGATGNTRDAEIQTSEQPLTRQTYDDNC